MKPQDKVFFSIGAAAIIFAASIGGYALIKGDEGSPMSTDTSTSSTAATPSSPNNTATTNYSSSENNTATSSSNYKDGTYTASKSYNVPHGWQNNIKVSLTVKSGKVTAVNATHDASDQESQMYIDSFDTELQGAVVGQDISSLTSFSRIGGASLTTYGFEQAISSIINEAKA